MKTITIATRPSRLAVWQAEFVRAALIAKHAGLEVRINPIRTRGDAIVDRPLREVEGKALFIKELEEAMARGEADLAVHCIKDFHTVIPDGFELVAYLARPSDRDALLTRKPVSGLADLPPGAVVGTTSERRAYELARQRSDFVFRPLRGNIDTRLARLEDGAFDAIVLAEAGLERLGLKPAHVMPLAPDVMMPAAGQGALGIEVRAGDVAVADIVACLDDAEGRSRVLAERAFLQGLAAGCGAAVGACSVISHGQLRLEGFVGSRSAMTDVRGSVHGPVEDASLLGARLAQSLLGQGARALLSA
ncbi:hydroxymethylbilane synthase [Azospirillum sp. YIM B02556]|uniref:Porphobilinogen deaminase n=1 Tax=Azospirillum endophyticum TaxID=2800326 RepID=A0ABS1FF68_9PROT|nr:hydroxymethylbilane synthase [Azospirillum endophyticum]MBK1842078.1 hydroxymethylbilane synthase [Azospirillum endophyticum]